MTHADPAKKFASVVKRLVAAAPAPATYSLEAFGETQALERELLYSFLLWDSNSTLAHAAYRKLVEAFVDLNHLRVAMPEEVVAIIGEKYPKSEHRAARLRAVLQDIFRREHTLSLARLSTQGKREARHYLESLEGMHGFVSGRLLLFNFGTHAVPLDDRLRVMLTEEHAIDPILSISEAQHWVEHQIPAENAQAVTQAFLHWIDSTALPRHGREIDSEPKSKAKTTKPRVPKAPKTAKPKSPSKPEKS